MAIRAGDQGFFTSKGVIKQDALSYGGRQVTQSSSAKVDSTVKQQAATITAAGVADAAVVKITARLGAGGTDFTSGVQSLVETAVSQGMENIAKRKGQSGSASTGGSTSQTGAAGGTYQNQLIADSAKQQAAQTAPPAPSAGGNAQPTPTQPADKDTGPKKSEGNNGQGHGRGGRYQDELIAESDKKAKGA